jgi:hypothetical protein
MLNDKVRAGLGALIKLWLPVIVLTGLWTPDAEVIAGLELAMIGTIDFLFLLVPSKEAKAGAALT